MIRHYCDKCGLDISPMNDTIDVVLKESFLIEQSYELCRSCTSLLQEWIAEPLLINEEDIKL